MSSSISKSDGLQPVVSFISVLVIGIVIAVYIVDNDSYTLPIILFSFFLGILIAAMELRVIIKRESDKRAISEARKEQMKDPDVKNQLARFVAELFDEDIPFDEIEKNSNQSKIPRESNDEQNNVSTKDN